MWWKNTCNLVGVFFCPGGFPMLSSFAGVSTFELVYGGIALVGLIIVVLLEYFGKK